MPIKHLNPKEFVTFWIKVIGGILLVVGGVIFFFYGLPKLEGEREEEIIPLESPILEEIPVENDSTPTPSPPQATESVVSIKGWMVDIKGAVTSPGTYAVDDSMRIIDVIYEAGGLLDTADTSMINLSKRVEDQMVIIIYTKEEVVNFINTKEQETLKQELCDTSQPPNDGCVDTDDETIDVNDETLPESSFPVSLNQATKEELQRLPGIGEVKADAIIAYRQEHPFTSIEQLLEVSGIGESLFASIKDKITL